MMKLVNGELPSRGWHGAGWSQDFRYPDRQEKCGPLIVIDSRGQATGEVQDFGSRGHVITVVDEKIGLSENSLEPIKEWVVWFQTPFGLHSRREEAIEKCKALDLDPELMINPVPVAIGVSGIYEIASRR